MDSESDSENSSLLSNSSYLYMIPINLLWTIIANLDLGGILNFNITSNFFNWYIKKIIPRRFTSLNFVDSVNIIERISELEQQTKIYENFRLYVPTGKTYTRFIPGYYEYEYGLHEIKKTLEKVAYSGYFIYNDGHERINKLSNEEIEKPINPKTFLSSCYRDPYSLLLMITILLLVTTITGWFIYKNVLFNLTVAKEIEKMMYKYDFDKNLELFINSEIIGNYHLPINKIFCPWKSIIYDGNLSAHECFSENNYNNVNLCFDTVEELDNLQNISVEYLEYTYQYYNGMYNVSEIENIFLELIRYRYYYSIDAKDKIYAMMGRKKLNTGHLKKEADENLSLFAVSIYTPFGTECIGPNNIRYSNRYTGRTSISISRIIYNTTCIVNSITTHYDVKIKIWYLILILCSSWTIFFMLMYYAL